MIINVCNIYLYVHTYRRHISMDRARRKLVLQHHPDKHPQNREALTESKLKQKAQLVKFYDKALGNFCSFINLNKIQWRRDLDIL